MPTIEDLSNELLFMIFEQLSHTDKVRLMRTCRRWQHCLDTPSVFKFDNFDYINRLCRAYPNDDDLEEANIRELERHPNQLTEMVIPYQMHFLSVLAVKQIFMTTHISHLVKLEILGGVSNVRLEVPNLALWSSTLEIVRLKECEFYWYSLHPEPQVRSTALRELRLVQCHIWPQAELPTSVHTLEVVNGTPPESWGETALPDLWEMEISGPSLLTHRIIWAGILATQQKFYNQHNNDEAPLLKLSFDSSPEILTNARILGFDCRRIKQLFWGHNTNRGNLPRQLHQCTGLEHLELGANCQLKIGYLEKKIPKLFPRLEVLSLARAESKFKRQSSKEKSDHSNRLWEVGIELRIDED